MRYSSVTASVRWDRGVGLSNPLYAHDKNPFIHSFWFSSALRHVEGARARRYQRPRWRSEPSAALSLGQRPCVERCAPHPLQGESSAAGAAGSDAGTRVEGRLANSPDAVAITDAPAVATASRLSLQQGTPPGARARLRTQAPWGFIPRPSDVALGDLQPWKARRHRDAASSAALRDNGRGASWRVRAARRWSTYSDPRSHARAHRRSRAPRPSASERPPTLCAQDGRGESGRLA